MSILLPRYPKITETDLSSQKSFLDRVNIGNARLYGLEEDLGLTGSQFQLAVSIFFVTYVLFE